MQESNVLDREYTYRIHHLYRSLDEVCCLVYGLISGNMFLRVLMLIFQCGRIPHPHPGTHLRVDNNVKYVLISKPSSSSPSAGWRTMAVISY